MLVVQDNVPPPPPAEVRIVGPSAARAPCTNGASGEVVVCGRDNSNYRLLPLPPETSRPGFFQRPHVVHIAPGVSVGLLGNGKGVGVRAEF